MPTPSNSPSPSGTSLPYELLSMIVSFCDSSQLFVLTQVSTTFRRLVYENMPLPLHIPRNLAIHLINQQPSNIRAHGEEQEGPMVPSLKLEIYSNSKSDGSGIRRGNDNLEPPFFTLADYSPILARNRWYRAKVVQIGGYGHRHENSNKEREEKEGEELSHDIFMLRCEARYEKWMEGVSNDCIGKGHSPDVGACVICQMKARRELFKANAKKKGP